MKRLILMLVLTLLIAGANAGWAHILADCRISYLAEDPNEPEAESWFTGNRIRYLSSDPNGPEPECALY